VVFSQWYLAQFVKSATSKQCAAEHFESASRIAEVISILNTDEMHKVTGSLLPTLCLFLALGRMNLTLY
jgi:hypothetical protein